MSLYNVCFCPSCGPSDFPLPQTPAKQASNEEEVKMRAEVQVQTEPTDSKSHVIKYIDAEQYLAEQHLTLDTLFKRTIKLWDVDTPVYTSIYGREFFFIEHMRKFHSHIDVSSFWSSNEVQKKSLITMSIVLNTQGSSLGHPNT